MLIFVREANGNGFEVEVDQNSAIKEFFLWLNEKMAENDEKFSLFFKGKAISEEEKSFAELNIRAKNIIHMKWITKQRDRTCFINVNVFHQNEIYSLRISNQETITKLKHRISQVTYVHPKSQRLFFRGKKLNQTSTINQEQIENDSLISLIVIGKKEPFEKGERYFDNPERELLDSISSVKIKRTQSQRKKASKCSLFRSDGWGIKPNEEYSSPEVQVKYVRDTLGLINSVDSEAKLNRLFNICMGNEGNSQQINGKTYINEDEILLGGSCRLGGIKLNKSFRFGEGFEIAEGQQENEQNGEEWVEKDKFLVSSQKAISLYKKLEFVQSSESIYFSGTDYIEGKSVYSQQLGFNEISDNPESNQ